jgi:uncharacterized membrane protein
VDWVLFAMQWLHVFLGVFWFGGVLYADFVVIPALNTLALPRQREIGSSLGAQIAKVVPVVAGGTILVGILRGTVFGQIKTLDALGTAYGITWLVALVAAVATFIWGARVIAPAIERLMALSDAEAIGADGQGTPALATIADDIKRKSMLELLGFVVVFTCMILMRFGY